MDDETIFTQVFFKGNKKDNIRFIDFGLSRSRLIFINIIACITV